MAKKMLLTIDSTYRDLSAAFITVAEIYHRIKRSYITIGGVYRPCGGEGLKYYGTITPLTQRRNALAATTVGDYAIFGGGAGGDSILSTTYHTTVEAYNSALTQTVPTVALTLGRAYLAATSVGDYALFAGGFNGSATVGTVNVYNKALQASTAPSLVVPRRYLTAATVGGYALFAGGLSFTSGSTTSFVTNAVDAYDASLTQYELSPLSVPRQGAAGATVGDYALFAGGYSANPAQYFATADAYNKSLTRSIPAALSAPRTNLAAATVGDHAIFAGGQNIAGALSVQHLATADAYNKSLTRTDVDPLSVARSSFAAATVVDYALFAGGLREALTGSDTLDAYDASLTRTDADTLSRVRHQFAAATVGRYALFAGGLQQTAYDHTDTVDAYTV